MGESGPAPHPDALAPEPRKSRKPGPSSIGTRTRGDAAAADRDGVDLRRRIDRAKTDVRALADASDALRQIEEMSAELGDRTASFGRELAEVAEMHGVTLS